MKLIILGCLHPHILPLLLYRDVRELFYVIFYARLLGRVLPGLMVKTSAQHLNINSELIGGMKIKSPGYVPSAEDPNTILKFTYTPQFIFKGQIYDARCFSA